MQFEKKFSEHNHSRVWTKEDDDCLRTMLADRQSVARIVLKLRRTRQAIAARANRLHLRWHSET